MHDRLLVLGDFNIHVCCPDKPMVKECCHLLDSLGFMQHINQSTHVLGHTLDLILSHGLSIDNVNVEDAYLSDHKPIVFNVNISDPQCTAKSPDRYARYIGPLTAEQFADSFLASDVATSILTTTDPPPCADELLSIFNSSCSAILDSIAPFKLKLPKLISQPWLDDTTRSLRRACRTAERKWKKDHLTVSFQIFKNSLATFQTAAKAARVIHFSNIISEHVHRPKILFSTLNSIINPQAPSQVEPSTDICTTFMKCFIDKINHIRQSFTPSSPVTSLHHLGVRPSALFDHFLPVSLEELRDIVRVMKPSTSPNDAVPSKIIKDVFDSIGPSIQVILNSCLTRGFVPASFKQAVVQPLFKKHNLDAKCPRNYRPISKLPFI